MSDAHRTSRQYDAMAGDYAKDNSDGAYNAYYERPATIALLGDVQGLKVLDVGCGSGVLSSRLVDNGAIVTAVDVSPAMADLARRELGDRVRVIVADIAEPLSFRVGRRVRLGGRFARPALPLRLGGRAKRAPPRDEPTGTCRLLDPSPGDGLAAAFARGLLRREEGDRSVVEGRRDHSR